MLSKKDKDEVKNESAKLSMIEKVITPFRYCSLLETPQSLVKP